MKDGTGIQNTLLSPKTNKLMTKLSKIILYDHQTIYSKWFLCQCAHSTSFDFDMTGFASAYKRFM